MQNEMYMLASVLDPASDKRIRDIWKWLADDCGLTGINLTPLPHISWQGAECYDFVRIEEMVKKFSQEYQPFSIKTSGLGFFTGQNPILYVTIVKNRTMLDVHKKLWDDTAIHAECMFEHYSPEEWIPHITLAARDLSMKKVECAVKGLIEKDLMFEVTINNLALLFVKNGEVGIKFKYMF